jgi:hypothetical protein
MNLKETEQPKEWTLTLKGPDGSVLVITAPIRERVCEEFLEKAKSRNAPAMVL